MLKLNRKAALLTAFKEIGTQVERFFVVISTKGRNLVFRAGRFLHPSGVWNDSLEVALHKESLSLGYAYPSSLILEMNTSKYIRIKIGCFIA